MHSSSGLTGRRQMQGCSGALRHNGALGRRGALRRNGISPLIATVLLLAFAVALGTMAVSYILEALRSNPCDEVTIAVQEGVPVCYRDGRVSIILSNRGDGPAVALNAMLKFIDSKGEIVQTKVPLALNPGASLKVDVPYQSISPDAVRLFINPSIQEAGGEKFCNDKEIIVPIQVCG